MVFINKGITLVLQGPLIKTRRLGVFNWSKMDLHVVHNWLNVTTYPITTTVFPNGMGRKTSPQCGNLGGLLISLWFQRAVIVETAPNFYLLPHQLLPLHHIFLLRCSHVLCCSGKVMTIHTPLWQNVSSSGCCQSLSRAELGNEKARNTLCSVQASSLGREACF